MWDSLPLRRRMRGGWSENGKSQKTQSLFHCIVSPLAQRVRMSTKKPDHWSWDQLRDHAAQALPQFPLITDIDWQTKHNLPNKTQAVCNATFDGIDPGVLLDEGVVLCILGGSRYYLVRRDSKLYGELKIPAKRRSFVPAQPTKKKKKRSLSASASTASASPTKRRRGQNGAAIISTSEEVGDASVIGEDESDGEGALPPLPGDAPMHFPFVDDDAIFGLVDSSDSSDPGNQSASDALELDEVPQPPPRPAPVAVASRQPPDVDPLLAPEKRKQLTIADIKAHVRDETRRTELAKVEKPAHAIADLSAQATPIVALVCNSQAAAEQRAQLQASLDPFDFKRKLDEAAALTSPVAKFNAVNALVDLAKQVTPALREATAKKELKVAALSCIEAATDAQAASKLAAFSADKTANTVLSALPSHTIILRNCANKTCREPRYPDDEDFTPFKLCSDCTRLCHRCRLEQCPIRAIDASGKKAFATHCCHVMPSM